MGYGIIYMYQFFVTNISLYFALSLLIYTSTLPNRLCKSPERKVINSRNNI